MNPFTGKPDYCSTVQEEDASPAMTACQVLKVPNGTVTDNGDGTFSFAPAGSGDITSVGDVASGAAFDGTQGTTLTFNDASGDQTVIYNVGGDLDFNFSDDVNIRDGTPHLQLIDTTASQDDFELTADNSVVFLSNVTDGVQLLYFDANNNAYIPSLVSCTGDIETNTLGKLACGTDAGGGGNSFETIATPAGTSPIADSSTDTLTITETSPLIITGTAATDTIDITFAGTDIGTDGLITANAVALGTDTTNNYVATIADDGTNTVTVLNSGSETADVTLKVIDVSCTGCLGTTEIAGLDISDDTNLSAGTAIDITGDAVDWDSTEVEATTWGAGGNASNLWTFNLSGTDPTVTWGSASMTLVGTMTNDGTTMGSDENLTIGSDTLTFAAGTGDFELSDDLNLTDGDPHLRLVDNTANQNDFELWADASVVYLSNVTDGVQLLYFDANNAAYLPNLANCDTIDTTSNGKLVCGTDASGAGGGDPVLVDTVAIVDANGIDLTGGTNGIDIALNAGASPDTATFNLDLTEVSSLTWGAGAFTTMTFDAGATDPVITAASARLTIAPGGGDLIISDDANLEDANPHLEFRDTTTDLAYQIHVDNAASPSYAQFAIWRGTDAGSSAFAVNPGLPLLAFDNNNDLLLANGGNVILGTDTTLGRLAVDGNADEIQLLIQGNATQTTSLVTFENSSGTDQFTLTNAGVGTFTGTVTAGGTAQSTITEGLVVNNGSGSDEDDDFIVNTTGLASAFEVDAGDNKSYFNGIGSTTAAEVGILANNDDTGLEIKVNANQAGCTATDIFIDFRSTTGSEGSVACTAVAGVLAFNTFLSSHYSQIEGTIPEVGQVVELTGQVLAEATPHLPTARLCLTKASRRVYGVFGGVLSKDLHAAKGDPTQPMYSVLGGGAGYILVSNANGDITAGDLLEADGRGYAQRQDDDVIRSSTIAKAVVDVHWNNEPHPIKLIGALLYSG